MALLQRLDLRQTQGLVMTPQLQQAIKLLQLSHLELAQHVAQELEQNPLLDMGEAADTIAPESEPLAEPDTLVDAPMPELAPAAAEAPLDTDFSNVWDGPAEPRAGQGSSAAHLDDDDPMQRLAETQDLRAHLLAQLGLEIADPADRLIGRALIDSLDECGWLGETLETLAALLGAEIADLERVLACVQRFDPPGLFARSLKECLALQLAERNRLDPAMAALLDHLPLVAARRHKELALLCGVDLADLADMLGEIRALDPKPALAFAHEPAASVVPDILMRGSPASGWSVELNAETLPRLIVNRAYHAEVARTAPPKATRDYLTERMASATWLVRALDQRASTVLKVASEIVRQQHGFFAHGISSLKPLILRDIAAEIGMHESTVSRATANKTIATPRGLFELKYFFSASIAGAAGEAHSAEAVRSRVKQLVDRESPTEVLSDDQIVETLKAEGVDIARRTVAKYRDQLKIPSSVQRKRDKGLGLEPLQVA